MRTAFAYYLSKGDYMRNSRKKQIGEHEKPALLPAEWLMEVVMLDYIEAIRKSAILNCIAGHDYQLTKEHMVSWRR